jgi:disease resistance protein RPS2
MTSRYRDVLSRGMGTKKKKKFLLQDLFKKMVGDVVKFPDLQFVAVEVAKRCVLVCPFCFVPLRGH